MARKRDDFAPLVKPSLFGAMAFGFPTVGTLMVGMSDLKFRQSQPPLVGLSRVTPGGKDDGSLYYTSAGFFGDFVVPAVADFRIELNVHAASPSGLTLLQSTQVEIGAGQFHEFAVPLKPRIVQTRSTPQVQSARVGILEVEDQQKAAVELIGSFLLEEGDTEVPDSVVGTRLEDLYVTIEVGGRDGFEIDGVPQIAGGRDTRIEHDDLILEDGRLIALIPPNVMVGNSTITVTRRQEVPANGRIVIEEFTSPPVVPLILGRYSFVPTAGLET